MEICLLGTGGMIPLYNRFLACCYIEQNQKGILIDCGEGTQMAFQKTGYELGKLDIIFITHCHADHIMGLPGILLTLGNHLKKTPLYLVGPKGVKEIISHLLVVCKFLPYPIEYIEVEGTQKLSFETVSVTAFPLFHPVPCIGYSMELEENKTKFKFAYCTDTRPVDTMKEIQNADLFVCEGMYGRDDQYENAVRKRHLLFSEAAEIAKQYNVKEMWLTHFSQSIEQPQQYLSYAQNIFPNTKAGKDFMKKVIVT